MCQLNPRLQNRALNIGWLGLAQPLNNQPDLFPAFLLGHVQMDAWQALNLMFVHLENIVIGDD